MATDQLAAAVHLLQLALEGLDAPADVAAVAFQLGFTGAAGADAAAQPAQRGAKARQPGQAVFQLGQLHLQAAFAGAGPLGENIQDQGGPVDGGDLQDPLDIADLGGGQLMVEDGQLHPLLLAEAFELLQPAAAQAGGAIQAGAALQHRAHHLGARRFGQLAKLLHGDFRIIFAGIHPGQHRPLAGGSSFLLHGDSSFLRGIVAYPGPFANAAAWAKAPPLTIFTS